MEVRSRAPGKIILVGKHVVVHGSAAVAATIDLYTHVLFRLLPPSDNSDGLIELELKDMDLVFSWPLPRLEQAFKEISPDSSSPRDKMAVLQSLVEGQNIPDAKIGLASGVSAFLHLYTSIHGLKPGKVVVTSDLPMGPDLGSSASFCVSISAALLALASATGLEDKTGGLTLGDGELELVNKWAFVGEKLFMGSHLGLTTK